ncbi:MAG: hypothetical protein K6V36_08460 [Anaerolineae bacterium]|nr:hypothetical protein [Anaerolineae bacterium]
MTSSPMDVAGLVIDVLKALDVPYMIGGSLASAVHGVARSTLDVDLVAALCPEHAEALVRALGNAFYADLDAIRTAIASRTSFNLIHLETMIKVDVFVLKGRPYDHAQFARRTEQVVAMSPERRAWVASAEDTILSKLEWYRLGGEVSERQWRDVLGIISTQAERLDVAYMRRWARTLAVGDLLERALTETSR